MDMKATVKLWYSSQYEIDLEDYGYDEETTFESLSEDEKIELYDSVREEVIVDAEIKTLMS